MIEEKKVLAITLARGGSKKIPLKNIVDIHGYPLIWYTFKEVNKSKYIDQYIVSTDNDEIEKICSKYNIESFRRSELYSSDLSKSADALLEVLDIYKGFDYVVEIMCTNPLKTCEDIDGCIKKIHDTQSESVVSVVRIYDHHPSRVKFIENDVLMDFYPEIPESRRQDLFPESYVRNGSIYAMKMEFLRKNKQRTGKNTRPYIMPEERSINIDEPIDLVLASILIGNDNGK